MKTDPKYFYTTLNSKSQKELDARIADNELRGFELVRSAAIEDSTGFATNSSYVDPEGVRRRYRVDSVTRKYQALMRRENRSGGGNDGETIVE